MASVTISCSFFYQFWQDPQMHHTVTSHVHDARYISTWYDTRIYSLIDKIHHSWYAIIQIIKQILDTGSRMSSECLPWHVIVQMYWPNEVSKQWRMVEGSQSSSKQMNLKENKSEQRDRGYQLLDNNLLNYYPQSHTVHGRHCGCRCWVLSNVHVRIYSRHSWTTSQGKLACYLQVPL